MQSIILLILSACSVVAAADIDAPAHFTVDDAVVVAGPDLYPIGFMNFCEPMGALKTHQNIVFRDASNEIPPERWFGLVNALEDGGRRIRLDGQVQSRVGGSCEGATARIYRIVDRQGHALPMAGDGKYLDLSAADRVIKVGERKIADYRIESPKKPFVASYGLEPGPEIRTWDAVFIEVPRTQLDDPGSETSWGPVVKGDDSPLRIVPHGGSDPRILGNAALAFSPKDADEHGIKQTVFGGPSDTWYGQLYPGQTYRLEVWMRQEGLGDGGKVRFAMAGRIYPELTAEFQVGAEWTKFTYDFAGPALPGERDFGGPAFFAHGPGTLYLDNPRIFAYGSPADLDRPLVIDRRLVETMVATQPAQGRKGFVRSWAAMTERSMDQVLDWYPPIGGDFRRSETIPTALSYCEATGGSPETRMNPWLTINTWYSEAEWQAFIEYLAAPYDPAVDTPESKPWAWRRVQQRGNDRPWIDEFAHVVIEFGNENWHNRAAHEWLGFGRAGWVHQDGLQYGMWGRYIYQEALQRSPYWSTEVQRKVIWNMTGGYYGGLDKDGNASGYGPDSMRGASPVSTMSSMALYVGPRLELGEKFEDALSDDMVQRALLAYPLGVLDKVRNTAAAREKLATEDIRYDLFSYEGGPAGYDLDRTPLKIRMGKSLALGLATAEAWLDSYRYGWRGHMLYASNQGDNWSNLGMFAKGMQGTPAWQVLTMINRNLQIGDYLACDETAVPTIACEVRDKKGQPVLDRKTKQVQMQTVALARCFAFRQGGRLSIGVLNLKLPGKHSGVDFGDGSIPCSVRIPAMTVTRMNMIRLVGSGLDTGMAPIQVPVPMAALRDGVLNLGSLPACSFSIIELQ